MTQSPDLHLTGEPEPDALLSRDPLALLIGMLLDQQVTMEKAFRGPAVIAERLGRDLDAHDIAGRDPEAFTAVMAGPPAVHRFPGSMGGRVLALCRQLVADYDGDAEAVWRDAADGADLLRRLTALPGFGQQKAKIFLALLGKQLAVRPEGWREAAAPYAEEGTHSSVADVVDADSLQKVRDYKAARKREAKAKAR